MWMPVSTSHVSVSSFPTKYNLTSNVAYCLLNPLDAQPALLHLLEDCHVKRSAIITSQLQVNKWYQNINESTLVNAIMDKLSFYAKDLS